MENNIIWLEIILLFLGTIVIIIAFFRPKDNIFIEEKVEKILEDFITQVNIENDEMIKKISSTQREIPSTINEKIAKIEQRLEILERKPEPATTNNSINMTPQTNQKYEEVLKLYESGEDVEAIVKQTQMGHAEVKLILELFKKGFKYV